MTMTVQVKVREDSGMFHGWLADVALEGNGSPEQFTEAICAAMLQARKEQIASRLKIQSEHLFGQRYIPQ